MIEVRISDGLQLDSRVTIHCETKSSKKHVSFVSTTLISGWRSKRGTIKRYDLDLNCISALFLHTCSMSMLLGGAVAFCLWWDIMCCDMYWRNLWLILFRASWRTKGYWIPPKTCNSGRLHNHYHAQTRMEYENHPEPWAPSSPLILIRSMRLPLFRTLTPCFFSGPKLDCTITFLLYILSILSASFEYIRQWVHMLIYLCIMVHMNKSIQITKYIHS